MTGPVETKYEFALLGAIVCWPKFRSVLSQLTADDFAEEICQRAFRACETCLSQGRQINRVSVFSEANIPSDDDQDPFVQAVDQVRMDGEPPVDDLVIAIKRASHLRHIARVVEMVGQNACRPGINPGELIADVTTEFDDIAALMRPNRKDTVMVGEGLEDYVREIQSGEVANLISTGIAKLDEQIGGGLGRGQLTVVAGSTSMGKSILGQQLAQNTADSGHGTMFINLEMHPSQVFSRLLSNLSVRSTPGIMLRPNPIAFAEITNPTKPIRDDADKLEQLARLAVGAKGLPLAVTSIQRASVQQIITQVRQTQRGFAELDVLLDMLVVDYLQLMAMANRYRGNRNDEVGEALGRLKQLAVTENIAVVVLSQLNRKSNESDGSVRPPTLGTLRDSGAIEQDADNVFFVYREAYNFERRLDTSHTNAEQERSSKLAILEHDLDIIVAKNRNGPTGNVQLYIDKACAYIADHAPGAEPSREAAE